MPWSRSRKGKALLLTLWTSGAAGKKAGGDEVDAAACFRANSDRNWEMGHASFITLLGCTVYRRVRSVRW